MTPRLILVFVFCVATTLAIWPLPQERDQEQERLFLPVYELGIKKPQSKLLAKITNEYLGLNGKIKKVGNDRLRIKVGRTVLELWTQSSGIYLSDYKRRWNPKVQFERPKKEVLAGRIKQLTKMVDYLNGPNNKEVKVQFTLDKEHHGTLVTAFDTRKKTNTKVRALDLTLHYSAKITVRCKQGKSKTYPIIGGGGEFNYTLGNEAKVIGMSGVWRPVGKRVEYAKVLSPKQADRKYFDLLKKQGVKVDKKNMKVQRTLAYYSAPASTKQERLYPVYAYEASMKYGKEVVQFRTILIPATKFATRDEPKEPNKKPDPCVPELVRACPDDDDHKLEVGATTASSVPNLNVTKFIEKAKEIKWKVEFNDRLPDFTKAHWTTNNAKLVDACDLIFHTSHAYGGGWFVDGAGNAKVLYPDADERKKDLWGNDDLEWIIIAGCGPLQDRSLVCSINHAAERWAPAFDGIHQLLGYATRSFETNEEGKQFLMFCTEDALTTKEAWFRAAEECQPRYTFRRERIYAGCLYAEQNGQPSTVDDHLWGYGFTAPDPKNPDCIQLVLSPT